MWLQAGSGFIGRGVAGTPAHVYLETSFVAANGTSLTSFDSNWVNNRGSFAITGNNLYAAAAGQISVAHYNTVAAADQWAGITVGAVGAAGGIGVALRCAAGAISTCYGFYATQTTRYLFKYVAGSYTQLASEVAATIVDDSIFVTVIGNTISVTYNGSPWGPGDIADSEIASGYLGIVGSMDAGNTNYGASYWSGGDEF